MGRYDQRAMALHHPIDEDVRQRLRRLNPNQKEFGRAIGRSQGWVNKYMHGVGNATIDDVIRIAALLSGAEMFGLTETDRRVLRALKAIPEELRADAVEFFENHARYLRRGRARESSAPVERTLPSAVSTKRGKR